jgi:hypothetical protein
VIEDVAPGVSSSAVNVSGRARAVERDGSGPAATRPAGVVVDGGRRRGHLRLWDWKARLLDLPLCRLLGQVQPDVPVYRQRRLHHLRREPTMVRQLEHWGRRARHPAGEDQDRRVVGRPAGARPGPDRRRAARPIGPDTELYVDANGGYTRKQAVRMARAWAESTCRWFEEPVSSDDLVVGLARVRDGVAPTWPPASTATTSPTSSGMAPVSGLLQADT